MNKALFILSFGLLAGSPAGAATTALQAVDGGGARAGSANYATDQSVGGLTGVASGGAPAVGVRHGYIGQLQDATAFSVVPETNEVDEGASQPLAGVVTFDDETAWPVSGEEVTWSEPAFPLADLTAGGVATADHVYEDTPAVVTGRCQEVEGTGGFLVRNTGTDDFGTYAGDGLPDDWQVDHFGVDSTDAGPTNNVDEDPLDNTGEWIADTDPRDGDSYFQIVDITNNAATAEVWFESSARRVYSLQMTTNPLLIDWQFIPDQTNEPGNGTWKALTDPAPVRANYYRVDVRVP